MIETDVLSRIEALLQYNHWSLYKLSKESGIPYSSLNNLFNRNTCPTIPTLEKICAGFKISLNEFFDFYNNPLRNTEITNEQQEIINAYEALSKAKKDLLKAYLDGLSNTKR